MYKTVEKLWLKGTAEKSGPLKRQIELCNQIGLFGAFCTVPYQVFYLLYDIALYLPLFLFNMVFIASYLAVPFINDKGHHNAARNFVLTVACTQIPVVTYFISADAGVHLFFFSVGSLLSLIFFRRNSGVLLPMLAVVSALFLVCHFLFETGATPVPEQYIGIMFTGSVLGAVALSASIAYLYRAEIDRAENSLLESNRSLEKLSTTDQLTGLANRRSLDQFLGREWRRMARNGQPLSMLMCDVDFFKAYNDHYGHQAGDVCLQKIGRALQKVVRRPSDLLVRYGGEEFAVILPHTTAAGAQMIAEKIRAAVEGLGIEHGYSEISNVVTISLGSSTRVPHWDSHWQPLLEQADNALYRAKTQGRNRVIDELSKQAPEDELPLGH